MSIEITDMHTPYLSAMKHVGKQVAFEKMSKIGDRVRKNVRQRMKAERHHFLQKSSNGKLFPYFDKNKTKELGERTNADGSVANPRSMSNFITSNLMEKSGTLIVGGRNKSFIPIIRRDGKIVGVGNRQPTITRRTQAIIHKLDTGEVTSDHEWLHGQEEYYKHWRFKGRGFMTKGFVDSISYMRSELAVGYEKTVGVAMNRFVLKPVRKTIA